MAYWQQQAQRRRMIERSRVKKLAVPYHGAVLGGIAFRNGVDPTCCPFELSTPAWDAWYFGWSEAFWRSHDPLR